MAENQPAAGKAPQPAAGNNRFFAPLTFSSSDFELSPQGQRSGPAFRIQSVSLQDASAETWQGHLSFPDDFRNFVGLTHSAPIRKIHILSAFVCIPLDEP